MPFAKNTSRLIGRTLSIRPVYGNGWGLYGLGTPRSIETPDLGFEAKISNVLHDGEEARVLICECTISLSDYDFSWAALIARADPAIDLRTQSVHCNIILSEKKPEISSDKSYPDPEFVTPNSKPYVRGFGLISLRMGIDSQKS